MMTEDKFQSASQSKKEKKNKIKREMHDDEGNFQSASQQKQKEEKCVNK